MAEISGVRANANDLISSGPDFIRGWLTERTIGLEPLAAEMLDRGVGLSKFATAMGHEIAKSKGKDPNALSPQQAMAAALRSKDFGVATARGFEEFIIQRLSANSDHRDVCLPVFAPDFKLVEFPTLDAEIELPPISESGEIQHTISPETQRGMGTSVTRRGALMLVSLETTYNDDRNVIERMLSAIAAKTVRAEHKSVVDALEGASDLADGEPVFSTDANSLVTGEAFSREAVSKAMAAMRRQPVRGEPSGHGVAWLVIPPEHEREAMEIRRDMTSQEQPFQIMVSPHLPANRFYALADWREAPAVAFLTLDSTRIGNRARQASATVSAVDPKAAPLEIDGAWFRIRSDHAALAVSRVGVVRVDAEE